ncbi:MAG: alpha/beta hydrolase [Erysipelotrichaceae bacterium]|nr:alpha/beta hydrolase [Erysipelotrichaceae bacterium]
MTVHEFGVDNEEVIVLIHPSLVKWDYYEYVIPLLEKDFHLIIPALPGYDDETQDDFTSVEVITLSIENYLLMHDISTVACLYGCSLGGAIVLKLLANNRINSEHAIIDGGITPYQLPYLLTRLIACRDFLMIAMGKLGGLKLLEKALAMDEYTDEDLQYMADMMKIISYRTIWRTFDSCNNYSMPETIETSCRDIAYWYSDQETKAREWDINYMKKHLPKTRFVINVELGHGGMALLRADDMAKRIVQMIRKGDTSND